MRLPMVLYGPSFGVEQEAVLRAQAASRCDESPYDSSVPAPSVIVVPDARFVDAIFSALYVRTEVLPPGDARRAPHGLSYGEHAALLQFELRLQDLDIPAELWGTEVSSVVRSVFERSAKVLWREFLQYGSGFLPRPLPDDPPCALGERLLADPSQGILTQAITKHRMVKEQHDEESRREIEAFVHRVRNAFLHALGDIFSPDVLRLESLRGDVCGKMDSSIKQRIGHVEIQRVSVERNMPRELFVRLVQGIVSALGCPELEVGVLSVTQALTKNCSSLLVSPPFQSGPVQLFLPMSVYGTPCRLLTMRELLLLIVANLRHDVHQRFDEVSYGRFLSVNLNDELAQLEFRIDGETHDVSVRNPLREKAKLLEAANWRRVPSSVVDSPDTLLQRIYEDLASQTGLSFSDVQEVVERMYFANECSYHGKVTADPWTYLFKEHLEPNFPTYRSFSSRPDLDQPLDVFFGLHNEEVLQQTG